ncbi:MAG TPA: serine hydrolase, partial [Atlantibacter hermannii]|nr:serine hydrolase [Atlantibacter hermannii]
SNAEDLIAYARYHISKTQDSALDAVFAEAGSRYYHRSNQWQGLAWVTDDIGEKKITWQVGYIGGYSSFIGFDKQRGNAVVVLQNAFNWSNYIGMTLLLDMADSDRRDLAGRRPARG